VLTLIVIPVIYSIVKEAMLRPSRLMASLPPSTGESSEETS